jgi:hypothetical protein
VSPSRGSRPAGALTYEIGAPFLCDGYAKASALISIPYGVVSILDGRRRTASARITAMQMLNSDSTIRSVDPVAGNRQLAAAITAMATRSARFSSLAGMGRTTRFERFIEAEAWIDAAMELAAIVAPSWTIRRLVRDDEWLCTLGAYPGAPDWLDDTVEGSHTSLPLAVLAALTEVEGKQAGMVSSSTRSPEPAPPVSYPLDCDNYR